MAAKHKILFDAEPRDVFEVITDYESYPEFIPEISTARILEETAQSIVVEFNVNLGKPFTYTLKFAPKPFESVQWTYVRGDFKSNEGSWTLTRKGKQTEGLYVVSVDLGMLVPKFVLTAIAGVGLPNLLKKFKARVESGDAKRPIDIDRALREHQKKLIQRYLRRSQQDVKRTAELLTLPEAELAKRMKDLGIG